MLLQFWKERGAISSFKIPPFAISETTFLNAPLNSAVYLARPAARVASVPLAGNMCWLCLA